MSANATSQQASRISSFRLFVSSCFRLLASPPRHWLAVAVTLAILSAILLPVNLLSTQRFHHDEALYATWALQITSGADPWLAHTPIDKPPLFLYIVAGAMGLLGMTEAAARLPSLLATALTVALTFGLGRKLYGSGVGVVAAWLVALSPFTILFAPTVFTDPLLVTLILASCLAAVYSRAGWAGLGLALAIATKQQGLFFMPLVMALLVSSVKCQVSDRQVASSRVAGNTFHVSERSLPLGRFTYHVLRITHHVSVRSLPLRRFLLAIILTLLPVFIWSLTRSQAPDFLVQSLVNYGGLITDATSFSERWGGFIELLQYGTASPVLNAIFVGGVPVLLLYGLWACRSNATADRRVRSLPVGPQTANNLQPSNLPTLRAEPQDEAFQSSSAAQADWLFSLFILFFLLCHTLFSFQVWDRYLLGLIPFLALLLARVLLLPWSILKSHWLDADSNWLPLAGFVNGLAVMLLLVVTLARPVQDAANGRYPLGSHSQALTGIEQIVAYLQGHAGANHTLYHRWLGTHWRFYLWSYPYDLQYWASPQELAAKAKPGHLIAFPSWQSETEARLALAEAGLALQELTPAYNPAGYPSIILYQIVSSQ